MWTTNNSQHVSITGSSMKHGTGSTADLSILFPLYVNAVLVFAMPLSSNARPGYLDNAGQPGSPFKRKYHGALKHCTHPSSLCRPTSKFTSPGEELLAFDRISGMSPFKWHLQYPLYSLVKRVDNHLLCLAITAPRPLAIDVCARLFCADRHGVLMAFTLH